MDVGPHNGRVGKNLLQAFLKAVNIVVDQMLSVNLTLIDQTHECKALIHLSQVKHNVLLIVSVCQSDDRRRLLVKLASVLFVVAVDARDINEHIDKLGADLVVLHVHGR